MEKQNLINILISIGLVLTATVYGFFIGRGLEIISYALVGAVLLLAYIIFSIKYPIHGLLVFIFSIPFERIPSLPIGGANLRISQVLLAGMIAAFLIRKLISKSFILRYSPYLWVYITVVISLLLSFSHMLAISRGMMVFAFIIFTSLTIWVIPAILQTKDHLCLVIKVLFWVTIIISIFGLYQFAGDMIGLPMSLTGLKDVYTKVVFGYPRVQSVMQEPLYLANFLIIPLALVITLYIRKINVFSSKFFIGFIALVGLVFLMTISRGGYLGLAVTLAVIFFGSLLALLRPHVITGAIITTMVLAVGLTLVINFSNAGRKAIEETQKHFFNALDTASTLQRFSTFDQAKEAFNEQPLTGIGIGNFGPWSTNYPDQLPISGWPIVNNQTLETLAETGMIGLGALLMFLLVLFVRSFGALFRAKDPTLRAIILALISALVGVLVQYQFFSTLYIMHIWVLIALTIATQNIIFNSKLSD
jgi:hypothetical protein